MDIQLYAGILLVLRLISMSFIFIVLRKQLALFKQPISDNIRWFRVTLFVLAMAVFIGNIIPAGIDILTVFADLPRSVRTVKPISLLYTMDAAGTSLVSSILIWTLYRMASGEKKLTDRTQHRLEDELIQERK
jgi:hypothetical protein